MAELTMSKNKLEELQALFKKYKPEIQEETINASQLHDAISGMSFRGPISNLQEGQIVTEGDVYAIDEVTLHHGLDAFRVGELAIFRDGYFRYMSSNGDIGIGFPAGRIREERTSTNINESYGGPINRVPREIRNGPGLNSEQINPNYQRKLTLWQRIKKHIQILWRWPL